MLRIRTNERAVLRIGVAIAAGMLTVLAAAPVSLAAEPVDASADALPATQPLALSMMPRSMSDDGSTVTDGQADADDSAATIGQEQPTPAALSGEFGQAGQQWLSLSFGMAPSNQTDALVQLGYHRFLADDFELGVFLGGWYHDQDENDAGSISLSLQFRYHFINKDTWSIYGLVGAGIMGSTDEVPDEGTQFNFLPTIGLGGTLKLGDGPARLDAGVRWHHISNANINGSGRNPDRDAAMIYVGVMFPF